MKRIISLMLVLVMVMMLAACGGNTTKEPANEAVSDDAMKVIYLVNGSLGDKGFFDSAASGINMMATELGAQTKIVEMGRDETSYESNFLDVSDQDWDLIISGTFSVKELSEQISVNYPDQNYLIFDVEIDFGVATANNILGVNYYSNQGAFLSGVLAAKMLLESGDAKIDSTNKTLGFIGSMDTPGINDFLVGYLEGVKYIDPSIKVLCSYVGSFEDVTKCMEMTTQLYNQGAQIVYAPVSQSILGSATAAANCDKYLIACDQDLYTQLVGSDPKLAANIITSSLKNVGESLLTAVKALQDGTMVMGNNYVLGLDSGAVGLAKNANYEALVSESIRAYIDEIEAMIISGELEVSSAFTMTNDEVVALRDSMN